MKSKPQDKIVEFENSDHNATYPKTLGPRDRKCIFQTKNYYYCLYNTGELSLF